MDRRTALLLALVALAGPAGEVSARPCSASAPPGRSPGRAARAGSGIKVDFAETPEPQQVTAEGFHDYIGTATFGDVILFYPREMPLLRQFRPADEVLALRAIESLKGQPVVNDHPTDDSGERIFVTPDNVKLFVCGAVLDAWREGNKLRVRVRIYDQQLLADIRAGKAELSLGYDCKTIPGLGTTSWGETYDAVQRGHLYNHVAVVGRGRAQGARLTTDAQDNMDDFKALIASGKLTAEDLKILLALLQEQLTTMGGAMPETDAAGAGKGAPAAAAAVPGDLEKRIAALEAAVAELKKVSPKADSLDDAGKDKLASEVAAKALGQVRTVASARILAAPILGAKADSLDDVPGIHRDVVATVFPEMKGAVEDHYKNGRADVLANLAELARTQHNRHVTADAADYVHRAQGGPPADLAAAEKDLAGAMTPKN